MSKKTIDKEDSIVAIQTMVEDGRNKDEVTRFLFENGVDKLSVMTKLIKEAGVKFRRQQGNTWKDLAADAFVANPDLDEAGMLEAIKDSVKDPEYYVKGYYHVFSQLVHGGEK